jgi:uncharacterized protein (TIGR03437 family)
MKRVRIVVLGVGIVSCIAAAQATLSTSAGPTPLTLSAPLDGPVASLSHFVVSANNPDRSQAHVKFKLDHVDAVPPTAPALLFFYPTSGTTPATIYIGVNPSVLYQSDGGGDFTIYFSTVDQSPPSEAPALVTVGTGFPPAPTVGSVVSSATYQPFISPGEVVSIFGANLAPPRGSVAFDATGLYPTAVTGMGPPNFALPGAPPTTNTTVTFNGIAAPLFYVSPSQIGAMVPYGVAGQRTVSVVVTRYGKANAPFNVPLADTSPGVFTAAQNGTGQGAILNVPLNGNDLAAYTYNSDSNPAMRGAAIEFFATGTGVWNLPVSNGVVGPPVVDGEVSLAVARFTAQPVSLTIGGQPARIYYAGSAPNQVWGMLQLIAFIPDGIGSGPQPLVLTIGQSDNSRQNVIVQVK